MPIALSGRDLLGCAETCSGKTAVFTIPMIELNEIRKTVSEMARADKGKVRVVVSPYRICPLGAHIDHQGGTVSAMTINKGILLGFTPSGSSKTIQRATIVMKTSRANSVKKAVNFGAKVGCTIGFILDRIL
ncbi:hypothetical protein K1719_010138 [Acacia pycnantha]|nr:hypothetical protein K1719_010138 [Acacia pycnantha]